MEKENKKLIYDPPKCDVSQFGCHDIITTSGDGWLSSDNQPNYDADGWT